MEYFEGELEDYFTKERKNKDLLETPYLRRYGKHVRGDLEQS